MLLMLILACCDNFGVSFEEQITTLTTGGDKYSAYEIHGAFVRQPDGTLVVPPQDELDGETLSQLSVRVLNPGPGQRLILSGLGGEDIAAPETSRTTLLVPLEGTKGAEATATARVVVIEATGESEETDESKATGSKETIISTYTPQRIKWLSFKNSLETLALSAGTLATDFDRNTTSYTAQVNTTMENITITATVETDASISGWESHDGNEWTKGYGLAYGENVFPLIITAQNGVTAKTYTVTVTRPQNYNITVASFEGGSITVTGGIVGEVTITEGGGVADRVTTGMSVTLTIVAESGYQFDEVYFKANTTASVGGTSLAYTFSMPAEDVTVKPRFLSTDTAFDIQVTGGEFDAETTTVKNVSGNLLKIKPVVKSAGQYPELNPGATFVLKTTGGIELPHNSGEYTLNPGKYDLKLTVTGEAGNTADYTLHVNNLPSASTETPPEFEVIVKVNGILYTTQMVELKWLYDTLNITVSEFDSYQWRLDGSILKEADGVMGNTLSTPARKFSIGNHTISIIVTTGEKSYAKSIAIEVQ
jgi:hypothetical protein